MKRDITCAQRDAIVADAKAVLRRHGISASSLSKFARIAGQEIAAENRRMVGVGFAIAETAGRAG